jgi:glycylpeptide N-tetradecanoyltransferase
VAQVYELLTRNYVEDDDEMFRFKYSQAFLQWALQVPGFVRDWHLGVRIGSSGRLMGFISAIPARVRVNSATIDMVEINFLCVHKKLRAKRLAPVLIKEITRRVNLRGIWQAAYTAGVVLPKPVATCQYWHRSLNPKKLIDIGFSRLQARMTMARTIKLYKLSEEAATAGIRPMRQADVPQVKQLLDDYLAQFTLAPVLSEAELAHALLPSDDVVSSYVVAAEDGQLTDLASFYTLPSSVIGHDRHTEMRAAFHYYTVPGKTPLLQLLSDALILAKRSGHDVYNALDLMQNMEVFKELKFGIGDGKLNYYLYNWRVQREMAPQQVGLVLL